MTGGTAGKASRRGNEAPVRLERRIDAARGYLALEMPEHVLRELTDAPVSPRHIYDVSRLRGDAYRLLDRHAEALPHYIRALAERPAALPVLMGIAACYHQLGWLARATAAVEEANRLHPNEPAVLFALARFHAIAGESQRALSWLGQAARICPDIADWAEQDPDFESLHVLPQFGWLVDSARRRAA